MTSRFCDSLLPLSCSAALVLAAALSPPALAAPDATPMLYKCVAGGVTSIQSKACAPGATTAWKRPAPPEAPMSEAATAQAEAKKLRDQQTVRELSADMERQRARDLAARQAAAAASGDEDDDAGPVAAVVPATAPASPADEEPPAVADPDLKACQDAQAFANAARDKAWLGLSEDQIRRMYGWVAQQCKVPGA